MRKQAVLLAILMAAPSAHACTMVVSPDLVWTLHGLQLKEPFTLSKETLEGVPLESATFVSPATDEALAHAWVDPPGVGSGMCPTKRVPGTGLSGVFIAQDLRDHGSRVYQAAVLDEQGRVAENKTFTGPGTNHTPVVYLQSPEGAFAYFHGAQSVASWEGFAYRDREDRIRFGLWSALGDPHLTRGEGRLVIVHDALWLINGHARERLDLATGQWSALEPLPLAPGWRSGQASAGQVPFLYPDATLLATPGGNLTKAPAGQYLAMRDGWMRFDDEGATGFVSLDGHHVPGPVIEPLASVTANPSGAAYAYTHGEVRVLFAANEHELTAPQATPLAACVSLALAALLCRTRK